MLRLNQAVRNKKRSAVSISEASKSVKATYTLLQTLERWANDIPPLDQPARFGNKAFRTWHTKLSENGNEQLKNVIEADGQLPYVKDANITVDDLAEELASYLKTSFGNETRIDYGSGHEAHFLVLLYCLNKVGVFEEDDDDDLVLIIFPAYLRVTRMLQTRYMLEPAGSHGVWGLDDYSFLPFLWGSSQLVSSTRISTTVISDGPSLSEHRGEYLYIDAIAYIKELKKGSFHEHSPILHNISAVQGGWGKINQGMIKMYRGEVWNKRPVIQHFLFGNVFQFQSTTIPPNIAPTG